MWNRIPADRRGGYARVNIERRLRRSADLAHGGTLVERNYDRQLEVELHAKRRFVGTGGG
jgi:hypothetical protein